MDNTREKLIELLIDSPGLCCNCGDDDSYSKNADWLITNGATVQKWIPVSERLPELYKTVLAYDKEDKTVIRWYDKNGFNIVDEYGYTYPVKTVTHWMPLPEAPKGE